MGLFFSKKQMATGNKQNITEHKDAPKPTGVKFSFVQSHGFKGYKRIRLSTYGYEEIEKSLHQLENECSNFDLTGKTIELREISFNAFTEDENNRCIQVFVEDKHVGTLFYGNHNEYYDRIIGGKVEKVFVMIKRDDTVYLVSDNGGEICNSDEIRYITYLFCKFSEE